MRWTVIVPMNALGRAKSRLVTASDTPAGHRALVTAMRADTVHAIIAASARLVVVTSEQDHVEPAAAAVIADPPAPGLNAALGHAAGYAAQHWPDDGLAVVVGDLPALTGTDLAAVLVGASAHPRSVVLDRHATGTTMLLVTPGVALWASFGPGSARRHVESGAFALAAPAAARCDVDVPADLAAARALGLGPHTRRLLPD